MKRQISAGAVIFRREPHGHIKFLLLYHGKNYWNFPKGKLEGDELATSAFLREVEEETGLRRPDMKILSGFRATDRYVFFAKGTKEIFKVVIFYLVETKKREITVSPEHDGYSWFTYREALRIAKFKNTRNIIKQAHEFIQKNIFRHPAHPQRPGRHLR